MKSAKNIDWDDIAGAIPAYILISATVFTYSISDGLGIGVISWCLLNCTIKGRVNWLLWVVTILFIFRYAFL